MVWRKRQVDWTSGDANVESNKTLNIRHHALPTKTSRRRWLKLVFVVGVFVICGLFLSSSTTEILAEENRRVSALLTEHERLLTPVGKTKIICYANRDYKAVGAFWYDRLKTLGYNSHTVIATDNATVDYLENSGCNYEKRIFGELPAKYRNNKVALNLAKQLFADRWVYLLEQLEQGNHVLLTDADNIFTRYVPMSEFENSDYDVFHAYATKYPDKAYEQMGFVVCGGMSWWRADPKVISFVRMMIDGCNGNCDDQVLLNNLLARRLNMTWHHTPLTQGPTAKRSVSPLAGMDGLLEVGVSGTSGLLGHRVKIWDRDFAFRGSIHPVHCPKDNWVAMPILPKDFSPGITGGKKKMLGFDAWEKHCGQKKEANDPLLAQM